VKYFQNMDNIIEGFGGNPRSNRVKVVTRMYHFNWFVSEKNESNIIKQQALPR